MGNVSLHTKRENKRKLRRYPELTILDLGWGASFVIGIIALNSALGGDGKGGFALVYGGLNFFVGTLMFFMSFFAKRNVISGKAVEKGIRKLGILCIPFVATGNVFAGFAGFAMAKEQKSLEYSLGYYAFLNNILIIVLSSINIFKPYVSNLFTIGLGLLIVLTFIYLVAILSVDKFFENKDKGKLKILAWTLMVTAISGNLFALILGLVILTKLKNEDVIKTIEWIDVLKRILRNYMAVLGLFVIVFLFSVAICSYLTFEYSFAVDNDYANLLQAPSLAYPFGSDSYGRCVFTRIAYGARISLIIGVISTVIPIVIGGFLGAVAGHYGNRLDNTVMRILDVLYAVPSTLLTIAIVAAFGSSTFNLVIALSIGSIPIFARTMRAQVMVVSNSEFVEAARACGRKEHEILVKHIIPNSLAPIIVRASLSIGVAILSTSSLSYLGLGVEPHIPEWGNILKGGSNYLETNPYLAIYPGIAIIIVVLAFNFIGDGLRDALDPKLK